MVKRKEFLITAKKEWDAKRAMEKRLQHPLAKQPWIRDRLTRSEIISVNYWLESIRSGEYSDGTIVSPQSHFYNTEPLNYQPSHQKTVDFGDVPAFTQKTLNVQPDTTAEVDAEGQGYGEIRLRLEYDFSQNKLSVTILDAHGLPAMDRNGMSDPYVKLCILPERKQKYETKIIRNSLDPVYNETFLFSDDKMGQLSIPLESIDFGTTTDICGSLCKPENDDDVSHNAYLFFLFVGDISVITAIHGHMSAWRNLNSERTRKANRTVPRVGRIFLFICLILNCIGYR
ncbi:unnamed protein product [Heligmosomoides polygyrus]|uniref:C2 domain-containing protein n=1 Tax=Heligmosomoides polygyrus TaxID=6339 RepID=A0A3P8B3M6_HELPZ|nr:unnamed protein product [Heligmosomoides polygyrus]